MGNNENALPEDMKNIAHELFCCLDDDSLWQLALSLQERGLIQAGENGYTPVVAVTASFPMVGFDRPNVFPVAPQQGQQTQHDVPQRQCQQQQPQFQQQQQLQQRAPLQVAPQQLPEATCHNDDIEVGPDDAAALMCFVDWIADVTGFHGA